MYQLLHGDNIEVLKTLPAESVHCVVTSPPYYGLRDYQTGSWQGGDTECDHVDPQGPVNAPSLKSTLTTNGGKGPKPGDKYHADRTAQYTIMCGKCGARRIDSQIGLEETPEAYVAKLVDVFTEVKRVLRDDGTLWLNLGDSYFSPTKGDNRTPEQLWRTSSLTTSGGKMPKIANPASYNSAMRSKVKLSGEGLKQKDLIGIPWMVAFALRADGWWLRSDIVWAKPNPMPESVTDRPTKSHEYVFLLTKSKKYFYDSFAIREPLAEATLERDKLPRGRRQDGGGSEISLRGIAYTTALGNMQSNPNGRNRRSVWNVTTKPFKGAHFAVFPEKLIEPCILAGTSEHGCCEKCGAPWQRMVERGDAPVVAPSEIDRFGNGDAGVHRKVGGQYQKWLDANPTVTTGWQPTCKCNAGVVPCTVLDPFVGSGTAGMVSLKYGRAFIGIDLNASYLIMAEKRILPYSLQRRLL